MRVNREERQMFFTLGKQAGAPRSSISRKTYLVLLQSIPKECDNLPPWCPPLFLKVYTKTVRNYFTHTPMIIHYQYHIRALKPVDPHYQRRALIFPWAQERQKCVTRMYKQNYENAALTLARLTPDG